MKMENAIINTNMKNNFFYIDTESKFNSILNQNLYKNISVSYSGGKDSDVILDIVTKLDFEKKINFVFFDTGIEYEATKRHIQQKIQNGHNIKIQRAFKPVPLVVKQKGQPFISKYVSEMLSRLQAHNFDFKNDGKLSYPELIKKYPKCIGALKWWCNFYGSEYDTNLKNQIDYKKSSSSSFNIIRNILLKEFLIENGLSFKVSAKCCYYSKKMTSYHFKKENNVNLILTGIRKAEGGIRSKAYKGCFINNDDKTSLYMPIFWWSNENVKTYSENNKLKFSDCYEKYGLKRTGCAGCPFGQDLEQERNAVKKFEPNLSRAIENIFKETYKHTNEYKKYTIINNKINKLVFTLNNY